MTAPHTYIPDGPVETAPYLGYEWPEIPARRVRRRSEGRRAGRLRHADGELAGRGGR